MPTTETLSALNREVRAQMVRAGKSQEHLAQTLGLTQGQVSARLRGAVGWRIGELLLVSDLLGTSVPRLLKDAEDAVAEQQAKAS